MPNSYVRVYVHCLWSTFDREPTLTADLRVRVLQCIRAECAALGVDVLALSAVDDHVHLLIWLPPTRALADVLKQCKGASSHLANQEIGPAGRLRWQGAYRAFSVSAEALPVVRRYVEGQAAHHGTAPGLEE